MKNEFSNLPVDHCAHMVDYWRNKAAEAKAIGAWTVQVRVENYMHAAVIACVFGKLPTPGR
jgi:hypothetical protein